MSESIDVGDQAPSLVGSLLDAARTTGTVLVVDDYPAVLAWAARAFERAGWTVLTATDGLQALSLWRIARDTGHPIGVLVTDLELPDWGGDSLAERLRADDPELPVLALHTGERDDVSWHAPFLNGTAFFHKPVRASLLIDTAAALLAARELGALPTGEDACPMKAASADRLAT